MKIRYEKKVKPSNNKLVKDIEIGVVFSGKINGVKDVYLKTDDAIVSLANSHNALVKLQVNSPSSTWHVPHSNVRMFCSPVGTIKDYKELDVELVVKGEL